MKLKLVAVAVTSLLAAGVVNAAEVYNKDGNKLDLYGKVHAQHYFSDDNGSDGDKTYARLGFKGETQINDQLTGFGQWEYEFKGNRTESQGADKDKTRLAFAGLKFADYGLSTTVVTTALLTTSAHGPTFCQSSVAIPGLRLTSS